MNGINRFNRAVETTVTNPLLHLLSWVMNGAIVLGVLFALTEPAAAQDVSTDTAEVCEFSIEETAVHGECPSTAAESCAKIEAQMPAVLEMAATTRAALARVKVGDLPIEKQVEIMVLSGEARLILIAALGARDLCATLQADAE